MQSAIALARQALGATSPNPAGGAVIVKDGRVIGEGFTLPGGAACLASTAITPNQAFRLGRHAYGLQFHLEVGRDQMLEWVGTPAAARALAAPGAPSREQLLAGAEANEKRHAWLCSSVLNRLFNIL